MIYIQRLKYMRSDVAIHLGFTFVEQPLTNKNAPKTVDAVLRAHKEKNQMQEKTYTNVARSARCQCSLFVGGQKKTLVARSMDELVAMLSCFCPSGRLSDLQGVLA